MSRICDLRFTIYAAAALLLGCCRVGAAELRFWWRANLEAELAGYKLYQGPASRFYTSYEVLGAEATNCVMVVESAGTADATGAAGRRYFALSAFDVWGRESDLTAEVVWEPPATVRVVSERSLDGVLWEAASTNDVVAMWPVEFWRLRIER
jgi:hypothetical protein